MSSATMGVLFRKAEVTMTGTIMRTCAQNTLDARPSTLFMRMSRPDFGRFRAVSGSTLSGRGGRLGQGRRGGGR
jgi:hypothetical protein